MEKMEICNLSGSVAYCEAMGLSRIFKAYAQYCSSEEIMEIGFNEYSGYVYIALENGIQIMSGLGHIVEYMLTDSRTGEETFYDSYLEANEYLN